MSNDDFLLPIDPMNGPTRCDPSVAIVFVHGANGDHRTTWTFPPPPLPVQAYWPELVKQDTASFGTVDVFAYDYISTKFSEGSQPVSEVARALRGRMREHNLPDYGKIVFVAHSLGGVVVRQFLVDDLGVAGMERYLPKTRLVLSLAAAYLGSDVATLVSLLGSKNDQLKEVSRNSSFLGDLNAHWEDLVRTHDPERGERPFVLSARAELDPVNSRDSAEQGTDAKFAFPKNLKFDFNSRTDAAPHTGICRPSSTRHESHQILIEAYRDAGLTERG